MRESVANALLHQDFSVTGAGPMVEIFDGRIEITNLGEPLVDTQRFLDSPPASRNEALTSLVRRFDICEERGGGIDKVVEQIERYQLPAPLFEVPPGSTRVVLFARKPLADMDWPPVIDKHGLEHALCARKLLKIISLRQLTGSWRQLVRTTGEQIPVVDG